MQRIPEPELMTDPQQARAYAAADFEQPHAMFVRLFQDAFPDAPAHGCVLDLGCGPGDITFRFARAHPGCRVHGIDGSEAMLCLAEQALASDQLLRGRVRFFKKILPVAPPPLKRYDIIISNSLLHHLAEPRVLWKSVSDCAAPGAPVFVMDLKRPESRQAARRTAELYAACGPEVLRRDFYNSLLAAFTIDEIREQLADAGLAGFTVREVSDRHVLISGRMAR